MSKFRLERVKEIKEKLLDDKKTEMENCIAGIHKITNNIKMIDDNVEANYNNIAVTTLSGSDYHLLKEHIIYLEGKKDELKAQREKQKAVAELLRSELVDLLKEVKMLEILKEKALRTIKKSENKREQKVLDELALRSNL
jgi:flagellar export protein FliJ